MKLRICHPRIESRKIVVVRERVCRAPVVEIVDEFPEVKHFTGQIPIDQEDAKAFDIIKDEDGTVTDFLNVRIKGYLSIWRDATATDRDGEYVERGAFQETIPNFLKNAVILVGHRNQVESMAGRFTTVREDSKGLYIEGTLSNRPNNIDVRFLVAEGTLKTLSIGGIFYYKEDHRGIFKVSLFEGSLVAIPADPDAIISTRALTELEKKEFGFAAAA